MELDIILKLAGIFVLLSLSILIILLVFYVSNINKFIKQTISEILSLSQKIELTTQKLAKDIDDLKERLNFSMENLDNATIQIRKSFKNIDENINVIKNIFTPFQELSKYVYDRVAEPLQTTARTISGVNKFFKVFSNVLSKK
ncbi:MAG: hypothetical protein ACUVQ1_06145 [Candidatus Kapaibacteriales bacterium]